MTIHAYLDQCTFRKATGTLVLALERNGSGFPDEVIITNPNTGTSVRFHQDHEAAMANEFWDGEQFEYFPIDPTNNCNKLVVHHNFE